MRSFILISLILLSTLVFAQAPPPPNPATSLPTFTINASVLSFPGTNSSNPATDIGATLAANVVFPKVPAGWYLRSDNIIVPSLSEQGFFGGLQGPLPYVSKYFDQNKFQPYMVGGIGTWRQSVGSDVVQSIGYHAGGGLNYDPTGTGRFSLNIIEVRATDKGVVYASTLKLGF